MFLSTFCTSVRPHSAIVMSSSLRMISSTRVTPGSPIAPSYYVVFCAACSLLVLSLPLKTYRTSPGN